MLPFIAFFTLQQAALASQGPAPYWQQRVVYNINARLDEPTQTLSGDQRVWYFNHSPDTLHTISFHLYLNAFRPGSRWSDTDSIEQRRRFNDLKDPDYGFNHVRNVKIGGVAVQGSYPFGRDSTIVRFALPEALPPGDSLQVTMDWDARTSIPPRRQGRRGRSYDFAQWYPRVVAYDKYGWQEHALVPAGEFYGEFGDFYVKFDVPKDQVVGATGVPVCGDPGWGAANRSPAAPRTGALPGDTMTPTPGATDGVTHILLRPCRATGSALSPVDTSTSDRKQIIWVARNVHHFAVSISPDYRYEGGEVNGTLVHVLYQPGDEKTWGNGIVVGHTITTLKWLSLIFGPYPWPQMTVVHRIEGGGTEFPMMQMNGSASLGLNLHEGGHTYLMGILANNEWKEGWLDEGFTSFQTSWFTENQARNDGPTRGLEVGILGMDLDGQSQPVSMVSDKFRDFNTYNSMIYSRGELFLQELRRMVGDETMLQILRTYYARWKLRHVDEAAFKAVAEEVSHRDLSQFFAQWLHQVVLTDYAIRSAKRQVTADGWLTTVNIARNDAGQFPVTVAVYGATDTTYVTADGTAESEQLQIATRSKPRRIALDPFTLAHDWNMLNNRYTFSWVPDWLRGPETPKHTYLDTWFSSQASRDQLVVGIMPTIWYNDAGGVTLGIRTRTNYLGRFNTNSTSEACGLRHFGKKDADSCGVSISLGNPTWWRMPNVSQRISAFRYEGRAGASVNVQRVKADHIGFGPTKTLGASVQWLATYDLAYLPSTLWDDGGSAEAAIWWGVSTTHGAWAINVTAKAAGGVMYRSPGGGFTTTHRYDAQAYARPEFTATARRALGTRTAIGLRVYAAAVFSPDQVLSQRRIFVAGADPYQSLSNPFVRSAGAPLVRDDCWCRWHTPGGGNLRGYNQSFSTDRLLTMNAEVQTTLFRPKSSLVSRIAITFFADGGRTGASRGIGGSGDSTALAEPDRWLADAGLGVRLTHRIGQTTWTSRIDFPFWVSDPQWAFSHRITPFGANRMIVSFSPVIR